MSLGIMPHDYSHLFSLFRKVIMKIIGNQDNEQKTGREKLGGSLNVSYLPVLLIILKYSQLF